MEIIPHAALEGSRRKRKRTAASLAGSPAQKRRLTIASPSKPDIPAAVESDAPLNEVTELDAVAKASLWRSILGAKSAQIHGRFEAHASLKLNGFFPSVVSGVPVAYITLTDFQGRPAFTRKAPERLNMAASARKAGPTCITIFGIYIWLVCMVDGDSARRVYGGSLIQAMESSSLLLALSILVRLR